MSFSKRQGNDVVYYTKPLDSLKSWNDRFFWIDAFACPVFFPWNTSKSVSKDPFPKSSKYNAEHYATLVAYPAPFHKYLKLFLCLIGISRNYTLDEDTYPQFLRDNNEEMDLLSFIQTADPTKVRIGERQRAEGEPKLLDTTVGRVVPLLPVALACASSELEASVDKLFDEGGSGSHAEHGDSVSGRHGVGVSQVSETAEIVVEDAAPKLREDHGTSSGPSVAGKSRSALQRLLAKAMLNPEVGVVALPTLPFITSFVSVTPEREDGDQTDFMTGANLRTITAPPRFVISSYSSHHSGANIAEVEVDYFVRPSVPLMTMTTTVTSTVDPTTTAKEKFVESSIFGGGSFTGAEHTVGGFSGLTGSDFIVGGIRTVVCPDTDLQKVPGIKAQLLMKEAEAAEATRLRAKVQTLANRNTVLKGENSELDVKVADLAATVKVREQEVADLDDVVTSVKVHNDNLSDQVHTLEVSSAGLQEKVTAYENFIGQLEKLQDDRMREINENSDKLDTDLVELALHLEEIFYPHLLTIISGRRWLLTHGLELAIAKCLNSTDVNFSLITELKSNKDASIDTIMNLLRLEDSLAERLGLIESQPCVDQLMVPIHHSPDQRVIGASALSLSLDVSSSRVQMIRENIANHRSALHDVFVPLSEPLSATALTGTEVISATIYTPTTPSTTLAFVSVITPVSIEDCEVAGTDGQEAINESVLNDATGGNVNPFPNVDDVELNVSQ
ncbi:hypothetical protein Tco_1346194 [Tanacetum coccineum]